jgi:hypothetical protein
MLQSRHSVLGKESFDHQQPMCRFVVLKKPAVSRFFFGTYPSHCISEATEDLDVHFVAYSTAFCNKLIADDTLIIKGNLQHNLAFAFAQAEFLFPRRWIAFPLT